MKNIHLHFYESPDGGDEVPDEIRAAFEAQVEAYHAAKPVALLDTLRDGGYAVIAPDQLADADLPKAIAKLAEGLALLRVYLESTDHLSDRELYEKLLGEVLVDEVVIFPKDPHFALHLDMIGSGSEEDAEIYLRYYADDESRDRWAKEFGTTLPPKEAPPFDRDRHLPKRDWNCDEDAVEN